MLLVIGPTEHSKIADELLGKIIISHAVVNLLACGLLSVTLRMKSYGGITDGLIMLQLCFTSIWE